MQILNCDWKFLQLQYILFLFIKTIEILFLNWTSNICIYCYTYMIMCFKLNMGFEFYSKFLFKLKLSKIMSSFSYACVNSLRSTLKHYIRQVLFYFYIFFVAIWMFIKRIRCSQKHSTDIKEWRSLTWRKSKYTSYVILTLDTDKMKGKNIYF
jgi:hypothetical protein